MDGHNRMGRFARVAVITIAVAGIAAQAPAAGAAELALKRVMLSSAGMGYFEYSATVDGNEELSLDVPLDQVDDVLKSAVILDSRGGTGTVQMPGREPLKQIFRDLPFGPGALTSPAAILNALQGAEIRVGGARVVQGRLLRAVRETVRLPSGQGTTARHRVSVMTKQGIQQFILEDAGSVSFVSPLLRAQVDTALEAIAAHRARDRRDLSISVRGTGPGVVTVGYVISVPLWKTAYRVTLPARTAKAPAHFQGWAVIDNMSGHDWKDVELTLVSGNPVTFRQALYTAYYVNRPNVPVEVVGRILPRVDEGTVGTTKTARGPADGDRAEGDDRAKRRSARSALLSIGRSRSSGAIAAAPPILAQRARPSKEERSISVPSAATAEQAATQVVFRLPRPVSAESGQSLMVPIIDRRLAMEQLSLYQPATHRLHPLATIRLDNDDKTGLPPGILTLYERDAANAARYVGDARLGVLPAGEKRMVSYALDQRTRIDRDTKQSKQIAKGRISRGVLELTVLDRQTTTYRIKAPAREDRRVTIEHPRRTGWELTSPAKESAEITPAHYRIAQELKAGAEDKIDVTLQRERLERIQLINLSQTAIVGYAKSGELDPKIRESFERMAELRQAIDKAEQNLKDLEADRKRIFQEQGRIRNNMNRIRRGSDLYQRYVAKLDTQETKLEQIDTRTDQARTAAQKARDALGDYVAALAL